MSAAADILVGTSGYSFADWVGPFYPKGTRPGEFLEYYAGQFPVIEINVTYYRIPKPQVLEQMAARTPGDFLFVVKLHQSMTHESAIDAARIAEFLAAIEPLKQAGKYEGLLAQFPWGFRRTPASKAHKNLRLNRSVPLLLLLMVFRQKILVNYPTPPSPTHYNASPAYRLSVAKVKALRSVFVAWNKLLPC